MKVYFKHALECVEHTQCLPLWTPFYWDWTHFYFCYNFIDHLLSQITEDIEEKCIQLLSKNEFHTFRLVESDIALQKLASSVYTYTHIKWKLLWKDRWILTLRLCNTLILLHHIMRQTYLIYAFSQLIQKDRSCVLSSGWWFSIFTLFVPLRLVHMADALLSQPPARTHQ